MTPLITCRGLEQSFSGKVLFEGLDLAVGEGDRLGLIGANGNGKTTLMQVMLGKFTPDEGEIVLRKGLKVGYVSQTPAFEATHTVTQAIVKDLTSHGIEATDANVRAATVLSRADFADPDQKVGKLSGGWKKRLQIVTALALEADVVCFDEPTNHLDLKGVLWLEDVLKGAPFAWVTVSHDRYFLDRTVNRIAELDHSFPGGVFTCDGSYSEFVRRREDYLESQAAYASSLKSKVRREDAWLSRGPKARTTKAQGRIDQAMRLKDELAQVQSRLKKSSVDVDFSASGRKTKKLITAESLTKQWPGEPPKSVVKDFDLTIRPGDRFGILGDNGSGKTTLLKMLAGELDPDSGSVKPAIDLKLVYFDQHRDQLEPAWTLQKALCDDSGDSVVYRDRSVHVVSWAARFRFRPEQLDVPVGELSGGEQARVVIARLMLQSADVLLLDEPTNDLDIPTLETLEESIADFPGAVVVISHDRFFLNAICNQFVGLDGKGHATLYGSYDQWQRDLKKGNPSEDVKSKKSKSETPSPATSHNRQKSSSKKLSYMDQREYDGMEKAIEQAETRLASAQKAAADPALATQAIKLQEAYKDLEEAQSEVDRLYSRWAELEAKMES